MKFKLLAAVAMVLLGLGCSHKKVSVFIERKIDEPKVIAIDGPREPWISEIELRLRKSGFRVLRWSSQQRVTERLSSSKTGIYNEASTRYILVINAEAYLDSMHRCFGGGFKFQYITADLVDVETNETLFTYSGSGYSEDCPPASGSIFGDIASAVSAAWKQVN